MFAFRYCGEEPGQYHASQMPSPESQMFPFVIVAALSHVVSRTFAWKRETEGSVHDSLLRLRVAATSSQKDKVSQGDVRNAYGAF